MTRHAEVHHEEWIAADIRTVQSQFADLDHHISANVHPKLSFRVLQQSARRARYVQQVRLLGIRQVDVFEREFGPDGSMTDTSVEGFNKGGSIHFEFRPEARGGRDGTSVAVTIRLPLPPVVGGLLRPLLQAQIRKELLAAVAEDKYDLEVRGYAAAPAAPRLAAAA
ncbi:SRPBCC family protein [Ideonella sp. YS5]|uniref:SRPBCC family protein n=1 Tax=Ideonella sp. YS5 TaxID=3453714 RepID=UPI003EE91759